MLHTVRDMKYCCLLVLKLLVVARFTASPSVVYASFIGMLVGVAFMMRDECRRRNVTLATVREQVLHVIF